ncbi:MAG TPA: MBL fold metallo-hydrolase [Actinobacteria bacterium]|nr:MBL fold metallo-hydrolase [Actinomycetota bacterium]
MTEAVRISRILAPNPGPYTLEGTNTWIVGRDPAVVIDPGPNDDGHLETVADEAGPVAQILLTHRHLDHAEGAPRLAELTGATVRAFDPLMWQDPLRDGEEFLVGGGRVRAVHTPGHTHDHVVFWEPDAKLLFTGDAVLGRGTSVVDPPDGDMALYVASLRTMLELRPTTIYPGHGPTVDDPAAKLKEYLDHRTLRERQVLAELAGADRPATPQELAVGIYTGYPTELQPAAARSVLAHLFKLETEGRVRRTGEVTFELAATEQPPHEDDRS